VLVKQTSIFCPPTVVRCSHHGGHSKLARVHFLCQPVDFPPCVAENNSLGDGDGLVEIAQCVQLPFLFFDSNIKLLDTFQRQLIPLHKNFDGLPHELLRHLQHVGGHSGREKDDLSVLRQKLEHLVNLVLEPTRQHLISLVETEYLDIVSPKRTAVDHVVHPARGTDNDLDALLELRHVLADVSAPDTSMALDVHVITEGDDDFLDLLSQLASGCENEGLGALDGQVYLLEN